MNYQKNFEIEPKIFIDEKPFVDFISSISEIFEKDENEKNHNFIQNFFEFIKEFNKELTNYNEKYSIIILNSFLMISHKVSLTIFSMKSDLKFTCLKSLLFIIEIIHELKNNKKFNEFHYNKNKSNPPIWLISIQKLIEIFDIFVVKEDFHHILLNSIIKMINEYDFSICKILKF